MKILAVFSALFLGSFKAGFRGLFLSFLVHATVQSEVAGGTELAPNFSSEFTPKEST